MIPAWFTRLDPRWKTPTRSIAVIVALAIVMGLLATYGTGAQEAFQVITCVGNIGYGIYYLMMFAIPLVVGEPVWGARGILAEGWPRSAALAVTLLAMGFNLLPIVDVASKWVFAAQGGGAGAAAESGRAWPSTGMGRGGES